MNLFRTLTDTLGDARQRGRGVGRAGDVALERVRLGRVLAHAHVLAEVGHVGLLAAGHVVAAVGHAADDGAKVLLALGGVGAGRRLQDVADRAEAQAFFAHLE